MALGGRPKRYEVPAVRSSRRGVRMGVKHARLEDRLAGFNELRRRALAVETLDAGCDVDEARRVLVRRERRHGTLGKADHTDEQVAARQGVDLPPGEAFDLLAMRRGFRAHSLA